MKKLILSMMFLIGMISIQAQNAKYIKTMEKTLAKLDTASHMESFQKIANNFERIANVEKEEWLPAYYQAYCHMIMASMVVQKQDMKQVNAHLDKAEAALEIAKKVAPEESEIYALHGFIYQGRIWENPQVNGAKFSPLSHQMLDQAINLNPENPRAYYLKGQNVFFTPAFWGGGAEAALPLLEKAAANYKTQAVVSTLHPKWGKERNEYLIKNAKASLKKDGSKKSKGK